jgi:hypothetical protein
MPQLIMHYSLMCVSKRWSWASKIAVSALLLAPNARALTFDYGELRVTFDSTLSAGAIYRLENPDPAYYGVANGGLQNSVNTDDGNLNYHRGFASTVLKGTHDLELKWRNLGAFARGTYFYDFENKEGDRERTPLSNEALDRVGSKIDYLDLYVRGTFELAGHPLDLRFGRQVLNLGESTFIPNGINVINAVDVSRLRVPGSELREALLPVNMVRATLGVSDNVTLGAFWLLEFRRTEIDPAGTYFSTNDFATKGGRNVYLGFGALSDQQPLGAVPRDLDHEANNFTQYGADVRISVPALDNTEFGLYFANYHSRLPVISSRTPTTPVNTNLTGPLTQVFLRAGLPQDQAAAQAAGLFQLIVLSQTNPAALTPAQIATLQAPQSQAAINGARQIALLTAAATGRYFIEYPEDIQMIGASFNTSLARTGIAWQGEIAYKHDVPLQIDDVELLFATLSALSPTFGQPNNQIGSYLGQYAKYIPGYRRKDVWTGQTTMTKVFGPMLGAGQFTLLGEVGGVYVNLPSTSVLRFDGAGTFTSGSQAAMNNTTSPGSTPLAYTPSSAFADPFSWGYQLLGRLEYNNLFAGVNFFPSVAFVHDVYGNTPLPLGNFVEGRKSVNVVAEFTWQNAWSLEFRYVNFFGAKKYNLLNDRDYVATTVKYSF